MTVELADLPRLTKQQFDYVQGVASGETLSDAAREAYPKSKLWSSQALWVFASRLAKNTKVVLWLKYLRSAQIADVVVTRQSYINRLVALMGGAIEAGNHAAAVRCWELLGKVEGFYVEKVSDVTPRSPQELEAALRDVRAKLAGLPGGDPLTRH